MKNSKEKGITLIALIITIIVLLILAGISISLVVGQNGVLSRAQQAGEKTNIASFAEEANLAYSDLAGEKAENGENPSDVTLQEVVAKLTDPNGDYKEKVHEIVTGGVTGITIEPQELTITLSEKDGDNYKTKSAKAQVIPTGDGTQYFAEIKGAYYEMKMDNNKITLGEKKDSLPDTSGTWNLTCNSNNTDITANADRNLMEVTVSSNKVGIADISINYNNGSSSNYSETLKVTVKEPVLAFRDVDLEHPLGADKYGNQVQLNGGSAIKVNKGYIEDNWKIFYADSDFVYLIYGDYYPVTNSDATKTDSNTIQTAVSGINIQPNTSYTRGVNGTSKTNLLRYLKNNSSYNYSSQKDHSAPKYPDGDYDSWKNLKTSLERASTLGSKIYSIQGSPDLTMWSASWNAKGHGTIRLDDTRSEGYYLQYNGNTANYYQNVSSDSGYNDALYFPYKSSQPTAYGYWLASPSGISSGGVMYVRCSGGVSYYDFDGTNLCARPVVSIPLADYNNNVSNDLKIN